MWAEVCGRRCESVIAMQLKDLLEFYCTSYLLDPGGGDVVLVFGEGVVLVEVFAGFTGGVQVKPAS